MKRILALISVLALLSVSATAQTATNSTTTVKAFASTVYDTLFGQGLTNLSVSFPVTYTPSIKTWGGGVIVTRNIPIGQGIATGVGIGVDYYDKNFYALQGQVSISADLVPFSGIVSTNTAFGTWLSKIRVTPGAYLGMGTPFSGQTGTSDPETVTAAFLALHLARIPYLAANFDIVPVYGTRTGLGRASGPFYGAAPAFNWKF